MNACSARLPLLSRTLTRTSSTWTINFSRVLRKCTQQRDLDAGKKAHALIIVSGFKPTIFVTNCLIQMYIKSSSLNSASKVFAQMPERDTVSWNSLIFGYSGRGDMLIVQSMFDSMPERDVISWNSLISGYVQNGDYQKSIDIFLQMGQTGVLFDNTTLALVLKSCSSLGDSDLGIQIHGIAAKMGFSADMVTGSALLDMYAKSKNLDDSLRFFDEMPEKNWVCWSAVIAGFVCNDQFANGLKLFLEMQRQDVGVSQSTYAGVFKSCAGLSAKRLGSQLHGHAIKNLFSSDVIVGTATLDMYAKCGCLIDARKVFDSMPHRSRQSHNAIMVGYAQGGRGSEALDIFLHLMRSGLTFDEISLSAAFNACAVIQGLPTGYQLHGLALKSNFYLNTCVANAILDAYGKCGSLSVARRVFDEMISRDAVSWNAIIAAYEQNGDEEESLSLFVSMLSLGMEPDDFTYGSVLKASGGQRISNTGLEIHGRIIKSGMGFHCFVGSALVDMYCKCGMMDEALNLHNRIKQHNMVSWNAIISGYSMQEQDEEAQKVFSLMLEMGVVPDNFTYATVLDICANLATIGLGKQIHAQIIKQDLQSDVYVISTLVDMYYKCGNMQDSCLMFEKASQRDFVTWNAMLCGYAYHGFAEEALGVFENMRMANVNPNHATFVAVLRACGHMGLVEKGLKYFYSMRNYGLDPQLDHYSCMVDILGKSGRVAEALKFIDEMPYEADDIIWRTLLSACKMHGDVEVAERAADTILQMEPQDSSVYILLANIYADAGMWDEVSMMREAMRTKKVKKEPGCSWIEVMSEVHTFIVNEKAHPKCQEIYENLLLLYDEMKLAESEPGGESALTASAQDELVEELVICASAI